MQNNLIGLQRYPSSTNPKTKIEGKGEKILVEDQEMQRKGKKLAFENSGSDQDILLKT